MNIQVTATALSLLLIASAAQAGEGRGSDRAERFERMRQHLQLTDAQVEEMRNIRAQGGGREDMRAVLTDEQREKADQARRQRHQRGAADRPRPEQGDQQ